MRRWMGVQVNRLDGCGSPLSRLRRRETHPPPLDFRSQNAYLIAGALIADPHPQHLICQEVDSNSGIVDFLDDTKAVFTDVEISGVHRADVGMYPARYRPVLPFLKHRDNGIGDFGDGLGGHFNAITTRGCVWKCPYLSSRCHREM